MAMLLALPPRAGAEDRSPTASREVAGAHSLAAPKNLPAIQQGIVTWPHRAQLTTPTSGSPLTVSSSRFVTWLSVTLLVLPFFLSTLRPISLVYNRKET